MSVLNSTIFRFEVAVLVFVVAVDILSSMVFHVTYEMKIASLLFGYVYIHAQSERVTCVHALGFILALSSSTSCY